MLVPDRGGRRGRRTSTFCYSALRDETGAITGMQAVAIETTGRVQAEAAVRASEERQAFLLALSDALRPLADPVAIQGEACRIVGEHLDVDRTYRLEIDTLRGLAMVGRDHVTR